MILAWLVVVALLVLPFLKRRSPPSRPAVGTDELVKDPVCQTYVLRSRAVAVSHAGVLRHFCSARCAEQYSLGRG